MGLVKESSCEEFNQTISKLHSSAIWVLAALGLAVTLTEI
jgi:hypothetical protein